MAYAEVLNQGITNLGNAFDQERAYQRQQPIIDNQIKQSEMAYDASKLAFDNANAQQAAKQQFYGVTNPQDMYAKEFEAEKAQKALAAKKQGWDIFDSVMGSLEKTNASPDMKTAFAKDLLGKNPEYADLVQHLNYVDTKSIKATRNYAEGELKDPQTGVPLPAGFYETEAVRTGDPANPFKLTNYKLATAPKAGKQITDQLNLGNSLEVYYADGTKEIKPIAAKPDTVIKVNSGGSNGKAPAGYRWTPDGNLEAIKGGPAALKADAAIQAKGSAIATYDETTAVIDKLLNHPGRAAGTGLSSVIDPRNYIPGTDAKDFRQELSSFDGKLFLANVSKMKGLGALSDAEGKKLTAAAGAIGPGMSDAAFIKNLNIIKEGLNRAKERIDSGNMSTPDAPTTAIPPPAKKGSRPPLGAIFGGK